MTNDAAPEGQTTALAIKDPAPMPAQVRPTREIRVVEDVIPVYDTAQFEHMVRVATLMADGAMLPESLCTFKGKDAQGHEVVLWHDHRVIQARAFMIVNQARIWKADPFAVSQCTSFVHGKLCYEGKLVNALIEARLGFKLDYEFGKFDINRRDVLGERTADGEWIGEMPDSVDDQMLGVRVLGKFTDEVRPRIITGSVGMWHKGSKSPWGTATAWPRQLRYMGAREWARAHAPSLMLGVLTDDEIDHEEEVQGRRTSRATARPKTDIVGKLAAPPAPQEEPKPVVGEVLEKEKAPPAEAKEGFNPNHVATELPAHDPVTGEVDEGDEEEAEAQVDAQREVIDHANPGESYLLEGDAEDKNGRWPLYKDGKASSSVGAKGLMLHPICRGHPPKPEEKAPEASNIRDNPEDRRDVGVDNERQEPEPEPSLNDELAAMNSWLQVKGRVSALVKSDDFKGLDPEDQAAVRRMIWTHVVRIKKAFKDPVDHATDITAFALWIETLTDKDGADAIDGTFNVIKGGEVWKSKLNDAQRAGITSRVATITTCLRG